MDLRALIPLLPLLAVTGANARIIEGTDAPKGAYPEVFAITHSEEGSAQLCTATLIHPRILLTSARCLPKAGVPGESAGVPVSATNAATVAFDATALTSTISYRHPIYDGVAGADFQKAAYDVGFVLLPVPVPVPNAAVAGLGSIADSSVFSALFFPDALELVGYGGSRNVELDRTTGTKRWARTSAAESTDQIVVLEGPHGGVAIGDSGSPVYLVGPTGRTLVAVASAASIDGVRDGLPDASVAAGMRPELVEWIEKTSGLPLGPAPITRRFGFGGL